MTATPSAARDPTWIFIGLASLVLALLNGFTSYLNTRFARGNADWGLAVFSAGLWLSFGALMSIPYFLAKRCPLKRELLGRNILAHLAGMILLCLTWTSSGVLIAMLLHRRPPQETLGRYFFSWILTNLPWSVLLYFTVLGCIYAFGYYREARDHEAQQARLAAQLAEARLGALRMQLNPHFLFNSLNAIMVLVKDERTGEAARMLELLSAVLRQVLQSGTRQQVTLDEELGFTERYLAIEEVRFSDRLTVRWSIDPALRKALVPEFILQPLVENAIRHGTAKRTEPGVIEVAAREEAGNLVLAVRDNGPGYQPSGSGGFGLGNTRARLETIFGAVARLHVTNAHGGGTIATITFPLNGD